MLELTNIRLTKPGDAAALAQLHAEAWRYACRGIIPGISLERMIARRGPIWWQSVCASRSGVLVPELQWRIAGYATFGRCQIRAGPPLGEIYVKPKCHVAGFGRAQFDKVRRRTEGIPSCRRGADVAVN